MPRLVCRMSSLAEELNTEKQRYVLVSYLLNTSGYWLIMSFSSVTTDAVSPKAVTILIETFFGGFREIGPTKMAVASWE